MGEIIATIIILILIFMSLGMHLAKHGEPRMDEYNFWRGLIDSIILLVLYYYAGLFNCFMK